MMRKAKYVKLMEFTLFLILLALTAGSCGNEEQEIVPVPGEAILLPDGRLRVPLQLNMNAPKEITTRSATGGFEKNIGTLHVLVWEADSESGSSSAARFVQYSKAEVLSETGKAYVDLTPVSRPVSIYAIANGADDQHTIFERYTEATTLAEFYSIKENIGSVYRLADSPGETNDLHTIYPKYTPGIFLKDGITKKTIVKLDLNACQARISVNASTLPTSKYQLESVQLLSGAKYTCYQPQNPLPFNAGADEKIAYQKTTLFPEERQANVLRQIYLHENNGRQAADKAQGTNPTELIVEGQYTDNKGTIFTGYHKIIVRYKDKDASGVPGGDYRYDIERNTLYTVKITEVKSVGYGTFEEAKNAAPANFEELVYEIGVTDGNSRDIVTGNGEYYIGFSNSSVILYSSEAHTGLTATTLTFDKTLDVTANADLNAVAKSVTAEGAGIEVVPFAWTPGTPIDVKVNLTTAFTEGKLVFRLGNLAKTVRLKREGATFSSEGEIRRINIPVKNITWLHNDNSFQVLIDTAQTFSYVKVPESTRWVVREPGTLNETPSDPSNIAAEPVLLDKNYAEGLLSSANETLRVVFTQEGLKGEYVGWLGGEPNGTSGLTLYTKRLLVEFTDSEPMWWANHSSEHVGEERQRGLANTRTLVAAGNKTQFPAAWHCWLKNDKNGDGIVTPEEEGENPWYLPASDQLMNIWIVQKALGNPWNDPSQGYWASSEDYHSGAHNILANGVVGVYQKNWPRRVRCVRDL